MLDYGIPIGSPQHFPGISGFGQVSDVSDDCEVGRIGKATQSLVLTRLVTRSPNDKDLT
jgi:hypothetical protein